LGIPTELSLRFLSRPANRKHYKWQNFLANAAKLILNLHNFVDSSLTSQASILRYLEDNWSLGRIGNQSFDATAGSLSNLFDFSRNKINPGRLFLDPTTGEPVD
jgi:hypothetical protein